MSNFPFWEEEKQCFVRKHIVGFRWNDSLTVLGLRKKKHIKMLIRNSLGSCSRRCWSGVNEFLLTHFTVGEITATAAVLHAFAPGRWWPNRK